MPGMFRSSTYIDEPVIRRGSSLRRTSTPTSRLRTMGTLLSRYVVSCRLPARTLTLDQTAEHSTVQHSRDGFPSGNCRYAGPPRASAEGGRPPGPNQRLSPGRMQFLDLLSLRQEI